MKDFYEYVKPGSVSVWVGNYRSEEEFDDYLRREFVSEFGFQVPGRAVREMGVESQPTTIPKLLQGFSRVSTFGQSVVEIADAQEIRMASCMFVIYSFKYDGSSEVPEPKIRFLGSVAFPGFG